MKVLLFNNIKNMRYKKKMKELITIQEENGTIEYKTEILKLNIEQKLIVIGRLEEIKKDILEDLY